MRTIAVAPMMEHTNRHFRRFLRCISKHTYLYTEMVTAAAIIHGDRDRLLGFSAEEHPLAVQLGGSDPKILAQAAKIAADWGYDEINLNVGCPSTRVQAGQFGACLIKLPQRVAECFSSMQSVVNVPVTVKTRIGVDHYDRYEHLVHFVETVRQAGCNTLIVHARKAWLHGLSPKENRTLPPLNYGTVYQLKKDFPQLEIIINGGIKTEVDMRNHLSQVDGVMLGREAYANPYLFASVDKEFYSSAEPTPSRQQVLLDYSPYLLEQYSLGVPWRQLSRHLMGLSQGFPGAKRWRRLLSESQPSEVDQGLLSKTLLSVTAES